MSLIPTQAVRTQVLLWALCFVQQSTRLRLAGGFTLLSLLTWLWARSRSRGLPPMVSGSGGDCALITGATSGIGSAIADELAARGFDLILVARSAPGLEAKRVALRARHLNVAVRSLEHDLAAPGAGAALADKVRAAGARVSILVNTAGVGLRQPLAAAAPARLRALLDLNVGAVVVLTRALLPPMVAQGRGRVLSVSSITGEAPAANGAAYHASKAFVSMFSLVLHHELEAQGVGVTVAMPGATDTGFGAAAGADDALCFHTPLCHHAPRDVARTAVAAALHGDAYAPPLGILNRLYVDVLVPLFPAKLTALVATTFWSPLGQLPWPLPGLLLAPQTEKAKKKKKP